MNINVQNNLRASPFINEQGTTINTLLTTNNQRPTINYQQPTPNHQPFTTNYQDQPPPTNISPMAINIEKYTSILAELKDKAILVAVSKTKPVEDIQELYDRGQRDFGENYVQELVEKEAVLPKDIRWHFIGHLQSNKVKYIAPFIHLIHGVDSLGLLKEINKQGAKNNRVIDCLLQVYIATEETKFGFNEQELSLLKEPAAAGLNEFNNIRITGFMGMASFSNDKNLVQKEFTYLRSLFEKGNVLLQPAELATKDGNANIQLSILSMGMSADYSVALEEGSNMVRIGSLLFGERNYNQQ